jgi:hypothetical protein
MRWGGGGEITHYVRDKIKFFHILIQINRSEGRCMKFIPVISSDYACI